MLIFISIPSKGTVKDGKIREEIFQDLATLYMENPNVGFVCTMAEQYQLLKYLNLSPTYDVFGSRCEAVVERCTAIWVLMYDGWDTSVGVKGEIDHAIKHKIEVAFVIPHSKRV